MFKLSFLVHGSWQKCTYLQTVPGPAEQRSAARAVGGRHQDYSDVCTGDILGSIRQHIDQALLVGRAERGHSSASNSQNHLHMHRVKRKPVLL